nr:MAG TPA: hypothetical protein [Caudoviricetes sp.]
MLKGLFWPYLELYNLYNDYIILIIGYFGAF